VVDLIADVAQPVMRLTAGAFAGTCVYIWAVQHPVRVSLAPEGALADFRAVIPRAERVQAPLLMVCLLAVAAVLSDSPTWPVVVGGALMLAVLVQTAALVLPINRRLLSGTHGEQLTTSQAALSRWGRLHATRTVLAVLAAVALCVAPT